MNVYAFRKSSTVDSFLVEDKLSRDRFCFLYPFAKVHVKGIVEFRLLKNVTLTFIEDH